MNNKILKFIALLLILAGSFSCQKNNNIDDMSNNKISNIENLYAQPLSVIQKCVQGKWKWYVSIGGQTGYNYTDNTFVKFDNNICTIKYSDGSQQTFHFTWEKFYLDRFEHETYRMWDVDRNEAGWYFVSIKNDTLTAESLPSGPDIPYSFGFVRIK